MFFLSGNIWRIDAALHVMNCSHMGTIIALSNTAMQRILLRSQTHTWLPRTITHRMDMNTLIHEPNAHLYNSAGHQDRVLLTYHRDDMRLRHGLSSSSPQVMTMTLSSSPVYKGNDALCASHRVMK